MKIFGDENNIFVLIELGKRIKDIRISHSITQKELAKEAGVSYNTVIRLENGEGANLENVIKIMRVLGILQNINLLIPEQELTPDEIFKGITKRKQASRKTLQENEWKWGDEK